ncbi:hypothetical protein BM221_007231 [Beauveria bassiana]|uniref:Uncharacterized protein n=1 Tax=Beauveria bassiana TaxID=176275 RepID=A0A2N6NJU2_BEABA|nr:hypothetical protein BM221_007231 [Beauveria bassiana]
MTYVTGAKNGSTVMPSALCFHTAIRDALSTASKFIYCNQQTYWQCYVYAHAIERYSVEIKYINRVGVAVVRIFGFLYCVTTTGASADDIAS